MLPFVAEQTVFFTVDFDSQDSDVGIVTVWAAIALPLRGRTVVVADECKQTSYQFGSGENEKSAIVLFREIFPKLGIASGEKLIHVVTGEKYLLLSEKDFLATRLYAENLSEVRCALFCRYDLLRK